MQEFQPCDDRVLVRKPKKEAAVTAGGLYVPETHEATTDSGVVVSVGPGRVLNSGEFLAREYKEGDTVVFQKGVDLELEVNGETLYLVECFNVLGVLKNGE